MTLLPRDVKAASVLKSQSLSAYIWTSTCLKPEEMQYDKFLTEFEEILQRVATVSDLPLNYLCNSIGRLHFDVGLLPALRLVGTRCRFSHIRKECLRILGSDRWREDLFDSYPRTAIFAWSCRLRKQPRSVF